MINESRLGFRMAYKNRYYAQRKHWIDGIKISSGCVQCGLTGPAEALTFDHVRGEKLFNVGPSWDKSRARILEEIEKCEVVCANCHNIRTKASYEEPQFMPFPKIPRRNREVVCSEKIDGTHAMVWVDGEGDVWAASRNRWVTPSNDNCGFAAWVEEHAGEFSEIGPCVIRGEWYGLGINRSYGMTDRKFAVFNPKQEIPDCCGRVPILTSGLERDGVIDRALEILVTSGSVAVPGFMWPEGIVIYHTAAKTLQKITLDNDESPKGLINGAV